TMRGPGEIARESAQPRLKRTARRLSRPGFTLFEVILVLVLLVVIGALTVPVLTGSFSRGQIRNASSVVVATWTEARLKAMDSGQPYLFRCQLKGAEFQVLSLAEFAEGSAPPPSPPEEDDNVRLRLSKKRLPSGVSFATAEFAPSQQLIAQVGSTEGDWSSPIVFQPDGTCSDATVLLVNESKKTVRVTLRGITGAVRVGDIGTEDAPE